MRELGLKTQMVKEDVTYLIEAGLIEQVDEPKSGLYVYHTTEKGKEALFKFYQLVTRFFT
jgi:predicted transcriptional regulator